MKPSLPFILVCASLLIAGCDEKTPSDRLTSATILPIAQRDAMPEMSVVNFKKENGWENTSQFNTYSVRYSYELSLDKPLPEATLALAHEIFNEVSESKKNPGFMGMNALQTSIAISSTASEWVSAQESFPSRRDAFLSRCKACMNYWNEEGDTDTVTARRYAYIYAWSELEKLGFKDSATTGDKVARTAWANFMKTEKGWMARQ